MEKAHKPRAWFGAGSMMLWPLLKLGCKRDITGSSMFQTFKVSDTIRWEGRCGGVALRFRENVKVAL